MTREEEIYNAMGDAEWEHIDGTKDIELFDMGFKEGAVWADAHPHWISVEDELPPIGGIVLVAIPFGGELSVLPLSIKNERDIECLSGMTHLMPLPQLPTLSNLENI